MKEREPFPQPTTRDRARNAIEAIVASAPVVGGAGVQLLTFYLPASLEKRRDLWCLLLDERLADVENRVLNDETFQSIVLKATKAAFGTHLEEKLQLLAEAVGSSADMVARDEDTFMAQRLLQWVDELEPVHFQVLGATVNPDGSRANVPWQTVLDRVPIEDDTWYQVLEDLISRRLVGSTGYNPEVPLAERRRRGPDDESLRPDELLQLMRLGWDLLAFVRAMADETPPQDSDSALRQAP